MTQLKNLLKPSINWLAIALPIAFIINWVPSLKNDLLLFVFSGLSMIVLASWMGDSTEQLAKRIGSTWGGILNASFGNLPEIIFATIALSKGLTALVKSAMAGAIIGNLLLIIGASMFLGGIKNGVQKFNRNRANDSSTFLVMSLVAILLPTLYKNVAEKTTNINPETIQSFSLLLAILLLITFISYMIYTSLTAKSGLKEENEETKDVGPSFKEIETIEQPWSLKKSIIILGGASVLLAFTAVMLTDSINVVKQLLNLTDLFLGVIVVAAIGNIGAMTPAVKAARNNNMSLSLEVSMGASVQIAILVIPYLVILSIFLGHPIGFHFTIPEVFSLFAAILVVNQITSDGDCEWINGISLIVLWLMIGVLFYFLPSST